MGIQLRQATRQFIADFVADEMADMAATFSSPADPFNIQDPCPVNPLGLYPLRVHREIVCPHCSKVLWS